MATYRTEYLNDGMPQGVFYREHATRKISSRSIKADRRFFSRYRDGKEIYRDQFGWETEGWTPDKAATKIREYKENRAAGVKPTSYKEELAMQSEKIATVKGNTVDAVYEAYRQIQKASGVSADWLDETARMHRQWISPLIGDVPIAHLKDTDVAKIVEAMRNGEMPVEIEEFNSKGHKKRKWSGPRAPKTIKLVVDVVKSVWIYAFEHDLTDAKIWPGEKLMKRQPDSDRQFFFTRDQVRKVLVDLRGDASTLKGIKGQRGSIDAYGQAVFSVFCGLRAGEILKIRWRDLELGRIFDTKNQNKTREIFPTPEVLEMLEERKRLMPNAKPDDLIFPGADGQQLASVNKIFPRCFVRCGINKPGESDRKKKAVFHSFRHTFGTWHAMSGTPLSTIAALMGHTVQKTTELYSAHCPTDTRRVAAQVLAGALELPPASGEGDIVNAEYAAAYDVNR